jgi:uncharacterized protein (DUF4415 family)
MRRKSLTDKSGEVRELMRADLRRFDSAIKVLPSELVGALPQRKRGQRGPQKRPTKRQITIRLDCDIVEFHGPRDQGGNLG